VLVTVDDLAFNTSGGIARRDVLIDGLAHTVGSREGILRIWAQQNTGALSAEDKSY
jgi:hypothetical protein